MGLATARTSRRVMAVRSIRSFECARHHHVEPLEQLDVLVERAVLEDVDLDAGEHAERAIRSLRKAISLSCSRRRSAFSPWATVSRGEWSVSTK